MMVKPVMNNKPHYFLFVHVHAEDGLGRWSFTLQPADGSEPLQAHDVDAETCAERLELQALAWALEALDQPSQVTYFSSSGSLYRGLRDSLQTWKANDWCWEYFGEMVPIAQADLWQRVDRALHFHDLHCRLWRFDPPQADPHRRRRMRRARGRDEAASRSLGQKLREWYGRLVPHNTPQLAG